MIMNRLGVVSNLSFIVLSLVIGVYGKGPYKELYVHLVKYSPFYYKYDILSVVQGLLLWY